ncbi:MAG: hypothetical protein HY707_09745 [Ignavibacteriae bacterium]|nr:hypothetical protein [Ignavibacteriota bacterium]
MKTRLFILLKFLGLVIALNVVRYTVPIWLEQWLILPQLFSAMERSSAYFNTGFTTVDWMTSYFYNFMMWLTIAWFFVLLEPHLRGNIVVKSLKVYGMALIFFISLSAIYMNHYSHPKNF